MVRARQPATPEEAETAYQEVVGSESVKGLLSEMVQTTMGPRQKTGLKGQNGTPKYFDIPDEEND
jgi:hypothetical protein